MRNLNIEESIRQDVAENLRLKLGNARIELNILNDIICN